MLLYFAAYRINVLPAAVDGPELSLRHVNLPFAVRYRNPARRESISHNKRSAEADHIMCERGLQACRTT
jgi:hypothetical protein